MCAYPNNTFKIILSYSLYLKTYTLVPYVFCIQISMYVLHCGSFDNFYLKTNI
jgi:hypothetical protein